MPRSPRRAAVALFGAGLAIAGALALLPVAPASTASVEVPETSIGHSELHIIGGVLVALNHTMAADNSTIAESMITLRGKLLQQWINIRFGDDGASIRCLRHGWVTTPGQNGQSGTVTLFRCAALSQPGSNADAWIDARSR